MRSCIRLSSVLYNIASDHPSIFPPLPQRQNQHRRRRNSIFYRQTHLNDNSNNGRRRYSTQGHFVVLTSRRILLRSHHSRNLLILPRRPRQPQSARRHVRPSRRGYLRSRSSLHHPRMPARLLLRWNRILQLPGDAAGSRLHRSVHLPRLRHSIRRWQLQRHRQHTHRYRECEYQLCHRHGKQQRWLR